MSSFPRQPAKGATSETAGQGPSYKDQVRNAVLPRQEAVPSSNPALQDQVQHADHSPPRRPPPRLEPTVPLVEATPVNPSVDRHLIEEERLQLERERLHLQQLCFTKKQWVIVGLLIVLVIVATSIATVWATSTSSPSPSTSTSTTNQASGSNNFQETLQPAMQTTTIFPVVSPTSFAPVMALSDAPSIAPTYAPALARTSPPTPSPSRSDADVITIRDFINSITLTSRPLSYPSQANPEERALQWLIEEDLSTDASDTLSLRQRFVLVTMWFANGPFDSAHTDTWLTPTGECVWESVANCVNGKITRLLLDSDGLSGSIPADIGLLTALTNLVMWGNLLTGSIPSQLGLLTALTNLSLLENQLTGVIPNQLGTLTALTRLNLSENELNGQIPSHILSLISLTSFTVYGNDLTGTMPFCDGDSSRFGDLLADCNELECECCTRCCTDGGARPCPL